jgi:hypothetical protein
MRQVWLPHAKVIQHSLNPIARVPADPPALRSDCFVFELSTSQQTPKQALQGNSTSATNQFRCDGHAMFVHEVPSQATGAKVSHRVRADSCPRDEFRSFEGVRLRIDECRRARQTEEGLQ